MAFCQKCGAQLEDSYKFCNVCGTMVTPAQVPAQPAAEPEIIPADPLDAQQSAEPAAPAEDSWEAQQAPQPESEPWNAAPQQQSAAAAWGAQQAQNTWAAQQQNPAYGAGYGYSQPPKKSGKKGCIIALVIVAVLVFALVAGAVAFFLVGIDKIGADDPNLGTYIGTKASMMGIEVNLTDILADGFVIELKAGGICRVTGGGENGTGKWKLEGNVITIEDGESTIVGTLEDGVMTFENMMDMGMDVVFYKDDIEVDMEASTEAGTEAGIETGIEADMETDMEVFADETVNMDTGWWNGEWYGWWTTTSCEGEFEDWEEGWWDCCAEITMDENGQGHLLLWDEDLPKDNALAEIDLTLTEGATEFGSAVTGNGYFLDRNVSDGDYTMEPSLDVYDNLLCMEGWYETEDGGFYFEVYLRPWGQLWDDMIADDEGYAPYFYEQYVQALENGESAPDDISNAWE